MISRVQPHDRQPDAILVTAPLNIPSTPREISQGTIIYANRGPCVDAFLKVGQFHSDGVKGSLQYVSEGGRQAVVGIASQVSCRPTPLRDGY